MNFLINCFLSMIIMFGLSLKGSQEIIQWIPQDNDSIKLFCYIEKNNIIFDNVDNKIRQRWQFAADKKIPFFSPCSIQSIKSQCEVKQCAQCPITTEQWNYINNEQKLRKTFLYVPVSVLQNNNGSWKKNRDLLFSATIADKHYDVYLRESQSHSEQQNEKCSYDRVLQKFYEQQNKQNDNVLQSFHEQQEKKIINNIYNNRMLLVWLLGVALPFYVCCENKEIKNIFIFTVTNLFFKICKMKSF